MPVLWSATNVERVRASDRHRQNHKDLTYRKADQFNDNISTKTGYYYQPDINSRIINFPLFFWQSDFPAEGVYVRVWAVRCSTQQHPDTAFSMRVCWALGKPPSSSLSASLSSSSGLLKTPRLCMHKNQPCALNDVFVVAGWGNERLCRSKHEPTGVVEGESNEGVQSLALCVHCVLHFWPCLSPKNSMESSNNICRLSFVRMRQFWCWHFHFSA
jgi:hypothetical protein